MKRYDISTPRSGNVSGIGGGIHSFAVSFVVKKSGTVRASDLGLPFFYIAPLQEGEVTITRFSPSTRPVSRQPPFTR